MIKINRKIINQILNELKPNKVIVIIGARRVGKTFLLNQILEDIAEPYIFYNGEDMAVEELLSRRSVQHYKNILSDKKLLIIDEAQKIPNIGEILKLMIDEIEGLKIIISGSSFDIANQVGEPLTGRKFTFHIYPLCESEYIPHEEYVQKYDNLSMRLIFGNYPELFHLNDLEDKSKYLKEIINSYLLKDILTFESVKNSSKIFNLLKLIAYQMGNIVSYQELGRQLSMSKNTVEKYLDLLSKVFIVFKLQGYSKNLRKEITKSSKWYFSDNGIRNAIIANLNPIESRNDIGYLWENYMISERIKYQNYNNILVNNYFWRTYDKQEIDLIEEREGNLFAYEFKWKQQSKSIPVGWRKAYPDSSYKIISNDNYFDWLT